MQERAGARKGMQEREGARRSPKARVIELRQGPHLQHLLHGEVLRAVVELQGDDLLLRLHLDDLRHPAMRGEARPLGGWDQHVAPSSVLNYERKGGAGRWFRALERCNF